MTTKLSGLRVAKRLDEVGFSDIVQIRNKVMALRSPPATKSTPSTAASPISKLPSPSSTPAMRALVENQTHYAASSGIASAARSHRAQARPRKTTSMSPRERSHRHRRRLQALYAAFQCVLDPGDDALVFSPYWTPIGDLSSRWPGRHALLVPTATAPPQRNRRHPRAILPPAHPRHLLQHPRKPHRTRLHPRRSTRSRRLRHRPRPHRHRRRSLRRPRLRRLEPTFSIASLPGMAERTITCFTFSKTYGMTGWRGGYAVAPEPFMHRRSKNRPLLHQRRLHPRPVRHAARPSHTPEPKSPPARGIPPAPRSARRRPQRGRPRLRPPGGAFYAFPNVEKITATAAPPPRSCSKKPTSPPSPAPSSAPRAKDTSASATPSPSLKSKPASPR